MRRTLPASRVLILVTLATAVSTTSPILSVVQDRARGCLHGKGELGKIRLSQFVRLLIVASQHARMLLARQAKLIRCKVFSTNIYFYGYMKL
jgi:hypothetical protein